MTRRPLPHAQVVVWSTLALFLAVLSLLVFQLRSGRDPALGRPTTALGQASVSPARRVLVRKVIIKRVVVHPPAEEVDDGRVAVAVPQVTTPAAPARSAPSAPVAAPAPVTPAPAPAPLTTRSS